KAEKPAAPARRAEAPRSQPSRTPAPAPQRAEPSDAERDRARRAAEAEAAALREMLSRPRKVLKAPEPENPAMAGTLHKPANAKGAGKKDAKATGDAKKTIKTSEVSSSWTNDGARKKPAAKGAEAPAARDGWRAGGKAG